MAWTSGAITAVVFLHMLGAAVWIGGSVVVIVANRLLARDIENSEERRRYLRALGRRGAPVFLAGFLLAAVTGFFLLDARGVGWGELASSTFWATEFGTLLAVKIVAALASVALAAGHGVLAARGLARGRGSGAMGAGIALLSLVLLYVGAAMRVG